MANITLSEREVRIQKVEKMKKMGIHPFAQSFQKKNMIKDIITTYEFAKILDSTGQIQLMFHRDNCKIIKVEKSQN